MLVFETHFDSYFYDSHLDDYFIVTSYPASYVSVIIFLGILCIIAIYAPIVCSGYDAHLILSAVKPRHGKITVIPNNMENFTSFTINDVTFIDWCLFMLSSLDRFSTNLSKDQFTETRKYLESFYIQQPNQPQANNVAEIGEEGEAMHIYENYQNRPYQPPTFTLDQQQQIEEDLALMTRKGFYHYEYMDSFQRFQEPQLPSKDVFYNSLTEEDISEID